MSEVVHYKGTMKKIAEGKYIESMAKKILESDELPTWYDSWYEYLQDMKYKEYVVINDILYKTDYEKIDPEDEFFIAEKIEDGYSFNVKYYNCGCGFDEALQEAVDNA